MFMSFQVSGFDEIACVTESEIESYDKELKNISVKYRGILESFFENVMSGSKVLDANKIQDYLFPEDQKHHIFLSHSHQDEKKVKKFAIYLKKEFGLEVFIDSCVWGNVFDILKDIDDNYSRIDNGNYSYDTRNYTTSNLYMILNTALHRKIKETELFLFLGTCNSIKYYGKNKKLQSAWLYSELDFVKSVSVSLPERLVHRISMENRIEERVQDSALSKKRKEPFIIYDKPELENEIDFKELWLFLGEIPEGETKTDILDRLYERFAREKYEAFKNISDKNIISLLS